MNLGCLCGSWDISPEGVSTLSDVERKGSPGLVSGKRCEREVKTRVISLCEDPEETEKGVCLHQCTSELPDG